MIRHMGLLLLLPGVALMAAEAGLPPKLFQLSFDGPDPLRADVAGGDPAPALRDGGRTVPGLRGNGFYLGKTDVLAYAAPGNLNKPAGSIELWVKPGFGAADLADGSLGYPCFFKEDAPLGPGPVNNLWLWLDGGRLRFDLRVEDGDNLLAPVGQAWRDTWHHLVITWDCQVGRSLFVNGHDVSFFLSDRPLGLLPRLTWKPETHSRFFVGNRGRDTYHTPEPLWGGCQSVVDEVAIYDRPLTRDQVARLYAAGFGATGMAPLFLARAAATLETEPFRPVVDAANPCDSALAGKVEVRLTGRGRDEKVLTQELSLGPGARTTLAAPALSLAAGTYELAFHFNGLVRDRQSLSVLPALPPAAAMPRPELVARGTAVALRATERYCESAPAAVRSLGEVHYLEAGQTQFDRIAFRFDVRTPGVPHRLRLFYPDDRERSFDVIISSPAAPCSYATQGGVLTGGEFELSNRLQSYDLEFWPREEKQALILTTWANGLPAAVSHFEVYELGLRLAPIPLVPPTTGAGRRLGLYWEDPMLSECFGGRHHERQPDRFLAETADRLVDYLRWTGQNTLVYPLAFYQGPGIKTQAEDLFAAAGAERHPESYVAMLLTRFEEAGGFGLIPELNFCASRRLLEPVATCAATPEAGYLAVSRTGALHTGMFPRSNPLHPLYQQRLTAVVEDFARQFGDSKALVAIQLHLVYESSFWFGSLEWGYDGFSVAQFRAETGVPVPEFAATATPAVLAEQRFAWLMANAREPWLEWRCRRLAEFYARLAALLTARRPDLKLIIGLRYLAEGDERLGDWDKAGRGMNRVYREAGLDFGRLAAIPNLRLQKYFYPADIAWQRMARGADRRDMYTGLELRRSDELCQTLTLGGRQPVSTNLYLNYFESAVDERRPIPGFWWDGPRWRVCALSPGGRNYLELFAESVALYDAPLVTTGGFLVGSLGHSSHVQEFARAFRALPDAAFATVPVDSDAVVVRHGDGGWLYAVSRVPFATTPTLSFAREVELDDLSSGERLQGSVLQVVLEPYQLRSFRGTVSPADIVACTCPVPADRRALVLATAAALRGCPAPGAEIAAELERELAAGNVVRCRHIAQRVAALNLLAAARQAVP